MMKAFWANVVINLKLTARDRMVLFFNYAFPLVFFFFFGQIMHAERGGAAVYVVSMVLTMGVLGNGFFGAGIRCKAHWNSARATPSGSWPRANNPSPSEICSLIAISSIAHSSA